MMIVIRVAMKVKSEEETEFVNYMKQHTAEVKQQFAGCEKFRLYEDVDAENSFLLYEEWQSQASFDGFKNSDYFKQTGEKLFPMIAEPPDTAYFAAEVLQ